MGETLASALGAAIMPPVPGAGPTITRLLDAWICRSTAASEWHKGKCVVL